MVWQDLVLAVGTVLFVVALIPAILHKEKPPATTSFLTGAVLASFVIVYISLSYWFAAIANSATATLWFIIGLQKLRRRRQAKGG